MRRAAALLIPLLLAPLLPLGAARAAGLYEAQAITTGTDSRERPAALAACLAQVLAKVSGNPALLDDPRVSALGPAAPGLLAGFAYLDRTGNLPKHDEQGTRDRPYDLLARFDPAGIDAALFGLGEVPWLVHRDRPWVFADISIAPRGGGPALSLLADTDGDERHRAALLAAADRFGLPVLLRPSDGAAPAAPATLRGRIAWAGDGWDGAWTLHWAGRQRAWSIRGVSFDEAYRNAAAGAAAALSGHGLPKS